MLFKLSETEKKVIQKAIFAYKLANDEYRDYMANGNVDDEFEVQFRRDNAITSESYLMGTIETIAKLHDLVFCYYLQDLREGNKLYIKYYEQDGYTFTLCGMEYI